MRAAVLHPPQVKINEFEEAKLFTARFYKIMTTISTGDETLTMIMVILNPGAGPKLVWEEVLPTQWLTKVQQIRMSIREAGNTTITSEGIISLTVEIGRQKASTVFGVALKPATEILLGTAFIDK